jgi:hypothetical protein
MASPAKDYVVTESLRHYLPYWSLYIVTESLPYFLRLGDPVSGRTMRFRDDMNILWSLDFYGVIPLDVVLLLGF